MSNSPLQLAPLERTPQAPPMTPHLHTETVLDAGRKPEGTGPPPPASLSEEEQGSWSWLSNSTTRSDLSDDEVNNGTVTRSEKAYGTKEVLDDSAPKGYIVVNTYHAPDGPDDPTVLPVLRSNALTGEPLVKSVPRNIVKSLRTGYDWRGDPSNYFTKGSARFKYHAVQMMWHFGMWDGVIGWEHPDCCALLGESSRTLMKWTSDEESLRIARFSEIKAVCRRTFHVWAVLKLWHHRAKVRLSYAPGGDGYLDVARTTCVGKKRPYGPEELYGPDEA